MNSLVERKLISEMICGNNFAYVLTDNSSFMPTEYKVLQSKEDDVFIKNMKVLYNGRYQFYYIVSGYKSFSAMLPNIDSDSFLTILVNTFAGIIDVKNYGFLSCKNIDASFEKIYVDPNTYKVKLIYLPVREGFYSDEATFENELRTSLVKLINETPSLSAPKISKLMSDLVNGTYSISDIYDGIRSGRSPVSEGNIRLHNGGKSTTKTAGRMKLIAVDAPLHIEIEVTKDSFVIGRRAGDVDGVIDFNKMIGRRHCCITHLENGEYAVTDLQSANGTYVNGKRLQINEVCPVKNGDIVRLANSDFQIVIRG